MSSKKKTPSLPRQFRLDFASRLFPDLDASGRNKNVTTLLRKAGEECYGDIEKLAASVRKDPTSFENSIEELSEIILYGWLTSASKKTLTAEESKRIREEVARVRKNRPGPTLSMMRGLSGVFKDEGAAEAKAYVSDVEAATGVNFETNELEEVEVTATNPENNESEEEQSMPTETNVIFDRNQPDFSGIIDCYVFNEAVLPSNLHYRDGVAGREYSSGQIEFMTGVAQATRKLIGRLEDLSRADAETVFASIVGLLLQDGHTDPDAQSFFGHVQDAVSELNAAADPNHGQPGGGFEKDLDQKRDVFKAVHDVLIRNRQNNGKPEIFYESFASVGRSMVDVYESIKPGDGGFAGKVEAHYATETLKIGGSSGGGSGVAFLDLPPLNEPGSGANDIVSENIKAISSIYVVYQCEQMLLFDVTDRIVELFMAGLLPMQGDTAARHLDNYYWDRDHRVSAQGRMAHYTRALGAPGGEIGGDVTANDEFNTLLVRVISSISEYERQRSVGSLFDRSGQRALVTSGEYVRKAIRDLAANCTLYGFAGVQFAAERMGVQLKSAMQILQLPRVREIYGVNSMWQVIERVAQSEFGTTINVVKHRTLAEETRKILGVVEGNPGAWSSSSSKPLFFDALQVPQGYEGTGQDLFDLSRQDTDTLFRATQYFLAVNGVQSDQVYEYSQPVDTPAAPSIPGFGAFSGMGSSGQVGAARAAAPTLAPVDGLVNRATAGRVPTAADILPAVTPTLG